MEYNLGQIFKDAFGKEPPEHFSIQKASTRLETSSLGSPYYGTDIFDREHFLPVYLNRFLLPFAVIGMSCKKNVINTQMPKRNGTVKELINIDAYQFNIKGLLINDDNSFPESEIIQLMDIFQINESVELRSVITDIVLNGAENHAVVITDIKWPAISGIEHAKPFELELESDNLYHLFKKQKK